MRTSKWLLGPWPLREPCQMLSESFTPSFLLSFL